MGRVGLTCGSSCRSRIPAIRVSAPERPNPGANPRSLLARGDAGGGSNGPAKRALRTVGEPAREMSLGLRNHPLIAKRRGSSEGDGVGDISKSALTKGKGVPSGGAPRAAHPAGGFNPGRTLEGYSEGRNESSSQPQRRGCGRHHSPDGSGRSAEFFFRARSQGVRVTLHKTVRQRYHDIDFVVAGGIRIGENVRNMGWDPKHILDDGPCNTR